MARCIPILIVLAAQLAGAQQDVVREVVIHGSRRIPQETIRARLYTKAGDVYDQSSLERDFNSLWNTGYFEDIRFEREQASEGGWIIHVWVKEKPTIREIKYEGLSSVSQSDVLDRFKERKVSLTQESQYDPTKVKKAEVVLKELLAEHGRQFATIRTEVRPIPPAAVGLTFVIKEGPKVKVGNIKFQGNEHLTSRYLRSSMKNLKPIGIPHSIFLEDLFSRTYDASKLEEDAERVRDAYQQKGYFKALVQEPKTQIRDTSGFHIPLIQKGGGKVVDITMPVEEGERYHLGTITFSGNKAVTNIAALRRLIPMKDGDIFNVELMRKGIKNLRDAYGELGYINFTPVPDTSIDDEKKLINLKFDLDEGKQYFVRRIEFKGNTTTRDKVIRRELALEEGNVYNSKLWEFSLLRLNQLGYFEPLKVEQDSDIKQDNQNGTVDITLKVKEKGKNSIGLNGGVSGLSGSFVGITYETNNFLGLGETLSVQASVGNRQRNILFGFTEPYLFDRPLQLGFTVFTRRYDFNQAKETEVVSGQKLNLPESVLQTLQNYSQSSTGFTASVSYPLRRSLKRVALTYSFDTSSIEVFSDFSRLYFQELNFRNVSGPDALKGIITSKVIPSFTMNTINSPMHPTSGRSIFIGGEISGLGGNVSAIRPIVEYKQFIPMRGLKKVPRQDAKQALGFRLQGSFLTGYAGRVAPPFERFYLGGDTDLRGFDIRTISPIAFFVERQDIPLVNPSDPCVSLGTYPTGCTGVLKDPNNPRRGSISVPLPVSRIIFPGGDTSFVSNLEYRIPIAGPVTLAPFADFGMNFVVRESQLQINQTQLATLNSTAFGCPALDPTFNCTGGTNLNFNGQLKIAPGTNYAPRMSTGLELQVIMPVINAPFRIYYAYNPLRLDEFTATPNAITRSMFPPGGAGDVTYQLVQRNLNPNYTISEPKKTFRFTVSTTF
ncbi:MAG TPA: outer membrane protein assembly factor BamA [Terriglobales bacterium]|nr:outer membrane protein assembly factor BamA [Terriglobales bacterium]